VGNCCGGPGSHQGGQRRRAVRWLGCFLERASRRCSTQSASLGCERADPGRQSSDRPKCDGQVVQDVTGMTRSSVLRRYSVRAILFEAQIRDGHRIALALRVSRLRPDGCGTLPPCSRRRDRVPFSVLDAPSGRRGASDAASSQVSKRLRRACRSPGNKAQ
jgi:hypothetical protein